MFPAEVKRGEALSSYFSSHTRNNSFYSLFSAVFWGFQEVILLFKMVPKHRHEVLSSMPKHNRAERHMTEKMHVLEKFCLGLSYSAAGHEFNVNDSTIHNQ